MLWGCLAQRMSFNSRTPGGVRPSHLDLIDSRNIVSIHAPREGCDHCGAEILGDEFSVSIHAPREGCDTTRAIDTAR